MADRAGEADGHPVGYLKHISRINLHSLYGQSINVAFRGADHPSYIVFFVMQLTSTLGVFFRDGILACGVVVILGEEESLMA